VDAVPQTDPTLAATEACCAEYEDASGVSRRRFLAGLAATSGAVVATSMFGDALRQTSFGATRGGNVVVVISLRGGIDGLGMVVPHGDPGYYSARPRIALPRNSLVAQDEMFGLHPGMAPLQWLWTAGEVAAVHAVGMEVPNRSHFLAMEEVEDADPTSSVRRGWVNRMIGLDQDVDPYEAVNLGNPITPTSLVGSSPVLATGTLGSITLSGATGTYSARRRTQLDTVWGKASGPLGTAARSALTTVRELAPVVNATYKPSVVYPTSWPATGLSDALKDSAQLIKADVGTEVVTIDYGSWDMHSDYGTTEYGNMQNMVGGFARVVSAFMRDLGPLRSRVTLVTISEFGRRVPENGNRGLDHGWGNMMLLMGGGVRGGYYADWPGLGRDSLEDGDLQVTTDYRNVLGELVSTRFPRRPATSVFPGLAYRPLGVMRA
jgi:uncharacterized protein (DUF1501 family)